jgi:hypothetical protein
MPMQAQTATSALERGGRSAPCPPPPTLVSLPRETAGTHLYMRLGGPRSLSGRARNFSILVPSHHNTDVFVFSNGATFRSGPGHPHYRGFTITFRRTTIDRTPLDEWSARRTDLYLTTHNTHKIQTSMPPAGFEPTIPQSEGPQTHALDGAAIRIGC